MYIENFNWSEKSSARNRLTIKNEPIQPIVLNYLIDASGTEFFIDIGANIGFYSLVNSMNHNIKKIYSFEANEPTYIELNANIFLNKLQDKIQAFNLGISSSKGKCHFLIEGELSGINSIPETTFHKRSLFNNEIIIDVDSIDNLVADKRLAFQDNAKIAFKIDVEGHEFETLKGMKNTLQNNKSIIQIEVYENNFENVVSYLENIGYEMLFKIDHDLYFTNFGPKLDMVKLFEKTSSDLIKAFNNLYPYTDNLRPCSLLKINYTKDNENVLVIIESDNEVFSVPEYCIYLYENNSRKKVMGYQDSNRFIMECGIFSDNNKYTLTAFCRQKNDYAIKHKESVVLEL